MLCSICGVPVLDDRQNCAGKCRIIVRLRNRATKQLLDVEEQTFGEGYDTTVKRNWIKHQLESISAGKQDLGMYKMYLDRSA